MGGLEGTDERFVAQLNHWQARGDRAALAACRRVLGRRVGVVPASDRLLLPLITAKASDAEVARYYLVAGLFGTHPNDGARGAARESRQSLGTALAALRQRGMSEAAVDRRAIALLNAEGEDLPDHLRRTVQLLRQYGISVDWAQLLRDLRLWDHPDRFVQRRWARAFWGAAPIEAATSSETEEA